MKKGTEVTYIFRTDAKGSHSTGCAEIKESELGRIFNMDGFNVELSEETKNFIDGVGEEFVRIPENLLDYTTASNFACYLRKLGAGEVA